MGDDGGTTTTRLHRILPSGGTIDLSQPDARRALLAAYQLDSAEHLRLTLVSTLDGRAAGADGTSESLTSRLDRTVLGVIRELSDAVIVGAETLRREPRLVPRARPLVVLSLSGDLGRPHRPTTLPPPALIAVTTRAGARRVRDEHPHAEVIVLDPEPTGALPLDAAIAALRDRGLRRIAAEGGPHVARGLITAGLVDELCLTIMPSLGGSSLALLGDEPLSVPTSATVRELMVDDAGALYGRWSLRP